MASPRLRATPLPMRSLEPPTAGGSAGDEAIWRRLKEAGFDEEYVKRRDKAALIAYIAKLETEIYDYQYHMGMLILERKDWQSKYEEAKASADSSEAMHKRDQAANLSALAEAKKREESLKMALSIEKECVTNIEKALHMMRAESAEKKLACEAKLAEARTMMNDAQKKFDEAEKELLEVESMHAEATRSLNAASRNLQDVEAREDDLRRRLMSFKSECEVKEREINLQRESLSDSQKVLHQEQEKLREAQSLLNQREEYIFKRTKELSSFEKELEEAKAKFEEERRVLKEQRSNLDLEMVALASREEVIVERESLLDKKERELLVLQQKIVNKEYDELQRLADEHQCALEKKRSELEAELEKRRVLFENELVLKRSSCEAWEDELNQKVKAIQERESSLEHNLMDFAKKQDDLMKRLHLLDEKEQILQTTKEARDLEILKIQEEREEINNMKEDLEKMKTALEDREREISLAQMKLELTECERNELLVLETKLKEEIDSVRAQKEEFYVEADKLKAEKEKFEIEWELIDEKREELRKETERIVEERKAVSSYLKNERDSLKLEKENLWNKFKNDVESLAREREEFVNKTQREHSEWFSKIQQERDGFVKDIMIQRKELENCITKRREEIESYLREKEETFEKEKEGELQQINSQKEMIAKELEHVALEVKRLEMERVEMARDREQREREWSEIKKSIEELKVQREKLQKQRELLHADREDINQQIQRLKKLEELDIATENRALSELKSSDTNSNKWKASVRKCSNVNSVGGNLDDPNEKAATPDASCKVMLPTERTSGSASPPSPSSWIRRCTELIFKRSPEKVVAPKVPVGEASRLVNSSHIKNKNPGNIGSATMMKNDGASVGSGNQKHKNSGQPEDAKLSLYEEGSTSIDGSPKFSLLGRKRPNSVLSREHADGLPEPTKKLQKKMKQKNGAGIEETTKEGVLSTQELNSSGECGPGSFNRIAECKETSNMWTCDENELLNDSKQLDGVSEFPHVDAHGNGRMPDSENLTHAANGGSSPHSLVNGVQKTTGKSGDELVADSDDEFEKQFGRAEEGDDEVDEDGERDSIKSKLWKFLIT